MAKVLESSVVSSIMRYLNGLPRCKAEKLMGNAFSKNKPDINGCWNGRMFKIEVKADPKGYKATQGQLLELMLWEKAGATTFIAYSVDDVKELIGEDYFAVPSKNGWKYINSQGKVI